MLIESDVILAAINPDDPAKGPARRVLDQEGLLLSPYSLLEVNLLARAGKLIIKDFDDFTNNLGTLLEAHSVEILSDRAEFHSVARGLETRFRMTFFDSLHAAASKVMKEMIVSFDRSYDKLSGEGVKRINPRAV